MAVQINREPGRGPLAWETADFAWNQRPSTWDAIEGDRYFLTATDSISLSDRRGNACVKQEKVPVSVSEACAKSAAFKRVLREHLQIYVRTYRDSAVKAIQLLSIKDNRSVDVNQLIRRSVTFAEKLRKTNIYQRMLQELITTAETSKRQAAITNSSSFSIGDDILHHSNAVISDIIIGTEPVKADIPPGYIDFVRFLPGDYTYTKALVKLTLEADMTADRPMVDRWAYNVDLPDIVKRGNVTLTAKNTNIKFDSRFYQIPEVTITMKSASGSVPIPNITAVTRDDFNVELRNSAGELVAGTISWQAIGC